MTMEKSKEKVNLNQKIVKEIIPKLDGKANLVDYLMNLLSMKKESCYRRIRNNIPFSFEEIAIIARGLDISIDQLIEQNVSCFSLNTDFDINQEPEDTFSSLLNNDIKIIRKMLTEKDVKITVSMNRIPFYLLPFVELFKFEYFHYMYSSGKISIMTRFSDIVIPNHIIDLHQMSYLLFNKLNNVTCIINSMVYTEFIKRIKFYYRSKFISDDDLQVLQAELFELLKKYESLLRNGKNTSGSEYLFYYSFFALENSFTFFESSENTLLQYWVYPESPIIIKNNKTINDIQKRWIDSKIRNSMLITKTNDAQQIEILRNIYKEISELTSCH